MKQCGRIALLALAIAGGALLGARAFAGDAEGPFHPVVPVPSARASAGGAGSPAELRIGQGQAFSYALPQGWRVGEDGQFALSLIAPDHKALTVMVGNAGVPLNYPPGQYAYEKLMAMRIQGLQLTRPRAARPVTGFAQAVEFDVTYISQGVPCQGIAKVSMNPAYDSAVMAMTAALSTADQWPAYSAWLPQVAEQVSATNGGAFGMSGLMQQNLRNSTAFAESARAYRQWSQRNWQGVTDQRQASQDRNTQAFRENLGAVQSYANPFGTGQPIELPTTYKYYWINQQDQLVGTDDPSANPNVGSTHEWRKLERTAR
ncbi:MAG: hypothetical protein U0172_13530 [Nitrospiraceae bacterium]